jgi:glycosyltransferase involved in cell wall biosynthesis
MKKKLLSFVIPAYNEASTIEKLLIKVIKLELPGKYMKEILVVDDGSKDDTVKVVTKLAKKYKELSLLKNPENVGKTQTVKNGIAKTTGDYVVIQDADLEYDPNDIVTMFEKTLNNELDVAYGDRFGGNNGMRYPSFFLGNKLVTFVSNVFTFPRIRKWIPDMEVCYKLVRGNIMRELGKTITATSSFGLEPEITAKLARYKVGSKPLKWGIFPISYFPRSVEEGKKIRYTDGLKAIIEIVKYNLFS